MLLSLSGDALELCYDKVSQSLSSFGVIVSAGVDGISFGDGNGNGEVSGCYGGGGSRLLGGDSCDPSHDTHGLNHTHDQTLVSHTHTSDTHGTPSRGTPYPHHPLSWRAVISAVQTLTQYYVDREGVFRAVHDKELNDMLEELRTSRRRNKVGERGREKGTCF